MSSFEMIYDEDEDLLEIVFEVMDENFARSVPLNENILLHTDSNLTSVWGLTFYSYKTLLQVSETHLDSLRELPEDTTRKFLRLISKPPVSPFLVMLEDSALRALVKAPKLEELLNL